VSATEPNQDAAGRYRIALRWGDIDALGHVNQAVYHELLEEARSALISSLPTTTKQSFVMAHIELDYRREIPLYNRYVEIGLRIEEIGRSSVTLDQQVFRPDGELAADGHAVMVAWDSEKRGSRPLNEKEISALRAIQASQA
jgi:acyl-CoA thioester hydrolase